jgi:hypothetical protein
MFLIRAVKVTVRENPGITFLVGLIILAVHFIVRRPLEQKLGFVTYV